MKFLSYNEDNIIKCELEMAFLTETLKKFGSKIKELVINYPEKAEEIKFNEDQLIELIRLTQEFLYFE